MVVGGHELSPTTFYDPPLTTHHSPLTTNRPGSPVHRFVILEKLPPDVVARIEAADDRVRDARGAVDDVQRRMESLLRSLARANLDGILVRHPPGVDTVHMNAVVVVVRGRGARHHVQRRLRHVRMRMTGRLEVAIELPLHG